MSRHHHVDRKMQDRVRRAALKRAGWRSESGSNLAGKLEAHHLVPLSDGGEQTLKNVVVLTREEHRALHRPQPDPDREAWTVYLEESNA